MLKKTALVKLKLAGFKHFTQRYVFMGLHKAGRSAESWHVYNFNCPFDTDRFTIQTG